MSTAATLLEMRGIGKQFAGVVVLDAVDLDVRAGEVHAVVGENGAGKSTLIKILTGALRPDSGSIVFGGRAVEFAGPRDSQAAGIAAIYQEPTRIPDLSVAENLFIGRQPRRWFGVDWRAMRAAARDRLARLGLEIDVSLPIGSYSVAVQQMVAIARALDLDARLFVMDEPTASLDRREVDRLLTLIAELSSRGVATIFIEHRLDAVQRVARRITVLRNGRRVGAFEAQGVTRLELVSCMLGRDPAAAGDRGGFGPITRVARSAREAMPERGLDPALDPRATADARRGSGAKPMRDAKSVLSVRALARTGALEACDLDVHAGETVGLAGLLGSGRSELLRAIFGADRPTSGTVEVAGRGVAAGRVRESIERGLAYCPEERQVDGLLPNLSVLENIVLVLDRGVSLRSPAREREIAEALVARLAIACTDVEQSVRTLSGGNQQKVILARWLAVQPRVLLLDEPTRGIDVGAKDEIDRLVNGLAREGMGVVWVTSSLDELLESSDRLVVMHARRRVAELDAQAVSEADVVLAMSGAASADASEGQETTRA